MSKLGTHIILYLLLWIILPWVPAEPQTAGAYSGPGYHSGPEDHTKLEDHSELGDHSKLEYHSELRDHSKLEVHAGFKDHAEPGAHAASEAHGGTGSVDPPETYSFDFRGEPLQQVLGTIAQVTETDMMFDPNMIGDKAVYRRVRDQSMPDLLNDILTDTSFDYIILSSGTIVIVEKVGDEPSYGTFTGKITDSRTGKPLQGATVYLADASGGTATNRNGHFNINRMMSGSYRIIFSYVGYEPVERVIEIRPDERVETEIELEPRSFSFQPVVVRAHRPNLTGIDPRQTMESLNSWEIAGGGRDAIRSLSLFPGLQYGLPMQDIHLQGGRQGEHRIRLDGIPVYNPHSFGNFYSAFSPLAIGEVQLHKAGFGAEQGSMIAGIIDFKHDMPSDGYSGGTLLADPLDVNMRGDASFLGGSSSSLKVTGSFRSNFWNMYKEPVMNRTLKEWDFVDPVLFNHLLNTREDFSELRPVQQTTDVRYFDGHAAIQYEPDSYNTIQSSLYFGKNRIQTTHLGEGIILADESEDTGMEANYLFTQDQYEWDNIVGQIRWDRVPGPRTTFSTQFGWSSNRMDHHYRMDTRHFTDLDHLRSFIPGAAYAAFKESEFSGLPTHDGKNKINHGILRSDFTYSISPNLDLESGLEFNAVSTSVDFSELFYLPASAADNTLFASLYTNLTRRFGSYWQWTAGSRVTRTDNNSGLFIEPRFSLQYDRSGTRIGYWTGRLSGGGYRQFINQFEITNVGPTSMVPTFTVWSHSMNPDPPRSYHITGSWINKPTDQTSLKLEAYYKWEPSAYMASPQNLKAGYGVDRSTASAFSESTRLKSRGASVRFHQRFAGQRTQLMLGYDYSVAEMDMTSQFGRTLPASWNEPHRIQARSIMRLFEPVTVIVNWKSVYGRSWGFRQAYYDYLYLENVQGIGEYSFRNPEKDRLSPFHQLDLSILYRPTIGSVKLNLRADLINVLNRRNTIDWSLVPAEQSETRPQSPSYSPQNDTESEQISTEYEIRERTMPGFYPTFRLEIAF